MCYQWSHSLSLSSMTLRGLRFQVPHSGLTRTMNYKLLLLYHHFGWVHIYIPYTLTLYTSILSNRVDKPANSHRGRLRSESSSQLEF